MTIKVAIHGAHGRMGQSVIRAVQADTDAVLAGAIEHAQHTHLGKDAAEGTGLEPVGCVLVSDLAQGLSDAQVVIDFGAASGTENLVTYCTSRALPLVVGTTGLSASTENAITRLSKVAAVVVSPNMSVGVNVLFHLARQAVQLLGDDFDLEIVEMHHRRKVDAPSGTAKRLFEVVAEQRGLNPEQSLRTGREGLIGARTPAEIGVMTLRGGDVVGDHTLICAADGERVELTHRAHDRSIFARGALRAAKWCVGKAPGRYAMHDVLGLSR